MPFDPSTAQLVEEPAKTSSFDPSTAQRLSLGMAQNNPGNLRPPGSSTEFESYPDMPTGVAANVRQLEVYQDKYGIKTVRGAVTRWVSDPNADLRSYISDVSNAIGVGPDDPVDFHNPMVARRYILAMQPHESGPIRINPDHVDAGVRMALGSSGAFDPASARLTEAPPPTTTSGGWQWRMPATQFRQNDITPKNSDTTPTNARQGPTTSTEQRHNPDAAPESPWQLPHGQVLSTVGQAFGTEPLGLSETSAKALQDAGIFPQPGGGAQPMRQINEAVVRGVAAVADTVWRAGGAGFAGAQQLALEMGERFGLPEALSRDIAAMPEAFMGMIEEAHPQAEGAAAPVSTRAISAMGEKPGQARGMPTLEAMSAEAAERNRAAAAPETPPVPPPPVAPEAAPVPPMPPAPEATPTPDNIPTVTVHAQPVETAAAAPEPVPETEAPAGAVQPAQGVDDREETSSPVAQAPYEPQAETPPAEAAPPRRGRQPQVTPYEPEPKEPERLISFLRRPQTYGEGINAYTVAGGVKPNGDLSAIVGGPKGRPGLMSKNGRDLDDAARHAWDNGYFPDFTERPSINDLLDAIRDDHFGMPPRYSEIDGDRVRAYEDARNVNQEIDNLASEHGIATKGLTRQQFYDAVSAKMSEAERAHIVDDRAQAGVQAYNDMERAAKQAMPDAELDDIYGQSQARTLEDLEREIEQENAAAKMEQRPESGEQPGLAGRGEEAGAPGGAAFEHLPELRQTSQEGFALTGASLGKARRTPEYTIGKDPRQQGMFGNADAAIQAQASRDQAGRGALLPKVPQKPADEGLFARREPPQPDLLTQPQAAAPAPTKREQGAWKVGTDLTSTVRSHTPEMANPTAVNWVFDHGRRYGTEHIVAVDLRTREIIHAGTDGAKAMASVDWNHLSQMPDGSVVIHHNHPSSSPLSRHDLQVLAYGPAISRIVEVGEDGSISHAGRGPNLEGVSPHQARTLMGQAYGRVKGVFQKLFEKMIKDGQLTWNDGNKYFGEAINRTLHGLGYIDYTSSHPLSDAVASKLQDYMESYSGRRPTADDRLTQSVRPDEGIASIPSRMGQQSAPPSGLDTTGGTGGRPTRAQPPRQGTLLEERERLSEPANLYSFPGALFNAAAWRRAYGPMAPYAAKLRDAVDAATQATADFFAPMQAGSKRAMAIVADFANSLRLVQYRFAMIDREITRAFNPTERLAMGRAMDAQSVFEQQVRQLPANEQAAARERFDQGGRGLAGLTLQQRQTIDMLDAISQDTWRQMQTRGMVAPQAAGLPYYFPRQILRWTEQEGYTYPGASSQPGAGRGIAGTPGSNLTTAGPMRRQHMEAADTLAAAKAKLGQDVDILGDIRSLPSRLAFAQRAIHGVDLMNHVEQIGKQTGVNLVVRGDIPGLLNPKDYYTNADHPAFRQWTGSGWRDIHIANEFKGPLLAVLSKPSSGLYKATQQLKGGVMSAIMWSPYMHLAVEIGRALPVMPMRVLTWQAMRDGNRLRRDLTYMDQATRDGLSPIMQGWAADPISIADQANVAGRNAFVRALTGMRDAVANAAGTVPKIGNWLHDVVQHPHQTLLWDQVFNLQVGIYDALRTKWTNAGFDPEVAGTMAAHIANRYAGALPPEHLARGANQAANLLLFSRSFTLGNVGVMKDMFNGAPSHIRARIEQMAGPDVANSAQSALRRKAITAFVMDIGLFYMANGLVQAGIQGLRQMINQGQTLPQAAQKVYQDWLDGAEEGIAGAKDNPLSAFGVLPQHWNEPGKQDRVYGGVDSEGRGIYGRLPIGKVGEEFMGWFAKPGVMLENKLSPLVRPIVESIIGYDSLGRQVYKPNPQSIGDAIDIAGAVVKHIGQGVLPMSLIQGIDELVRGDVQKQTQTNDDGIPTVVIHRTSPWLSAAKIVGPMTGLAQISSGFPGGPAAGEMHAQTEGEKYDLQKALPAIRDKIKAGDTEGAVRDLEALNVQPGLIKYYLRQTLQPGPSAGMMRRLPTMPPEVQQRVQRQLTQP